MFISSSQTFCWSKGGSTCQHAPTIAHQCEQICLVVSMVKCLDLPKRQWGVFSFSSGPRLVVALLLLIIRKCKLVTSTPGKQGRNSSRKVLHRRELPSTFVNALCTQNSPGEIRGTVGPWSQAGRLANSKMFLCLWSTSAGLCAAPSVQEFLSFGAFCRGQCSQGQHRPDILSQVTPLSELNTLSLNTNLKKISAIKLTSLPTIFQSWKSQKSREKKKKKKNVTTIEVMCLNPPITPLCFTIVKKQRQFFLWMRPWFPFTWRPND